MKKNRIMLLVLAILLISAGVVFAEGAAEREQADYPTRDVTVSVAWGAGGGTDVICRIISQEMAEDLGTNFNVINKPGGNGGSVGMSYVLDRSADGYTVLGQVFSLANPAIFGGDWKSKYSDAWEPMLIGGSPESIAVPADSKYQNLNDLIADAKARPGEITVSIAGVGNPHHLNLLAFVKATGLEFRTVPYNGSAPSQNALMAGEVDVTFTSVAEQAALLKGKKIRSLGLLANEGINIAGLGTIPSVLDDYEGLREYLPVPQILGMAVRADVPEEYKTILIDSFNKAVSKPSVLEWAADNYYVITGDTGDEARKVMDKMESLFSWTVFDIGAAEVSPDTFGIPRM